MHPRGRYTAGCPVCEGKRIRAQQRRKLRSGDPVLVERVTEQDISDLQEAQQRLQATAEATKIRLDGMVVGKSDPGHIATLANVLDSMESSLDALDRVLQRHHAVIVSLETPEARHYRRKKG